MKKEEIQTYLPNIGKYVALHKTEAVSLKLQSLSNDSLASLEKSPKFKNPKTYTLLYWLLPGFALVDRLIIKNDMLSLLKAFSIPLILVSYIILIDYLFLRISLCCLFWAYLFWLIKDGFTVNIRVRNNNLSILLFIIEQSIIPLAIDNKNANSEFVFSRSIDFNQLEKLHDLKVKGIITEEEFSLKKKEILKTNISQKEI